MNRCTQLVKKRDRGTCCITLNTKTCDVFMYIFQWKHCLNEIFTLMYVQILRFRYILKPIV